MNLLSTTSLVVNLIAILAVFYFIIKIGRLKERLEKISFVLKSSDNHLNSVDKIIAEITSMELKNQRLESIVEATPFPMLITDSKGKIVSANQAGLNLLEINDKKTTDFIGKSVSLFFYNDPERPSVTDKVIESRKKITGIEASLTTRKGKTIHVLVDSGPIISKSGELIGAFSIAIDITRQKSAELEVTLKNESLATMRKDAEIMSSQLSTSIEAFKKTVNEIQDQVIENDDIAKDIHRFLGELKESFAQFNTTLTPVISSVNMLGEDFNNIQSATALIKSISEQTDILSLNARIEAERSSSSNSNNHGFKVVAKEVKELAIKSKEITNKILKDSNHIREVLDSSASSLEVLRDKSDTITSEFNANSTSEDLSNVSSAIRNTLTQVDGSISEMSKTASNLNRLIREA